MSRRFAISSSTYELNWDLFDIFCEVGHHRHRKCQTMDGYRQQYCLAILTVMYRQELSFQWYVIQHNRGDLNTGFHQCMSFSVNVNFRRSFGKTDNRKYLQPTYIATCFSPVINNSTIMKLSHFTRLLTSWKSLQRCFGILCYSSKWKHNQKSILVFFQTSATIDHVRHSPIDWLQRSFGNQGGSNQNGSSTPLSLSHAMEYAEIPLKRHL